MPVGANYDADSGRTVEQKRKLAQRITDVMVEEAELAAKPSWWLSTKCRKRAMRPAGC